MNANCLDDNGNLKLCPYRIFQEEHKALCIGDGDVVTQEFYPCLGQKCIGYHVGICLRLHEALQSVE